MKKSGLAFVALVGLFFHSIAFAGAEADVFARLAERLLSESQGSQLARHLMTGTAEGRTFSEALLDAPLGAKTGEEGLELTLARLRERGDMRLAGNLEKRLDQMESQYVSELTAHPDYDPDALLACLSKENLGTRLEKGRVVFLKQASSGLAEAAREFVGAEAHIDDLKNQVMALALQRPDLKIAENYAAYQRLGSKPEFVRIFPAEKVYRQLMDQEMIHYTKNLGNLFSLIEKAPAQMNLERKVSSALRISLHEQVPADSIAGRVQAFLAGEYHSFERALGDMTLPEVQRLLYGADPLNPSAGSLLGKYLRETGAASVVRGFPLLPGSTEQGPKRLVVGVSPASFAVFIKYFARLELMSIYGHAYVAQNGRLVSYAHAGVGFRLPHESTLLPQIVLKTTEGQRAWQYLDLLKVNQNYGDHANPAMRPSSLAGAGGNYCAAGAYVNCTQWIGNIPLGDQRVLEYTFPGTNGDHWADFKVHNDPALDALPRAQRLRPYVHDDPLVKRVWKFPGNQQFSEVIGMKSDNLRGNFANPGWLISTILGPAPVERVPVVFLVRADHTVPIDPAFIPQFERPM